mmetsp:Transcript_140394/g.391417  ORF Transcript_140394/g.391417 Transcript_140394/m.391417 type:complete len:286 (-) Transcript_140394:16-873(-)
MGRASSPSPPPFRPGRRMRLPQGPLLRHSPLASSDVRSSVTSLCVSTLTMSKSSPSAVSSRTSAPEHCLACRSWWMARSDATVSAARKTPNAARSWPAFMYSRRKAALRPTPLTGNGPKAGELHIKCSAQSRSSRGDAGQGPRAVKAGGTAAAPPLGSGAGRAAAAAVRFFGVWPPLPPAGAAACRTSNGLPPPPTTSPDARASAPASSSCEPLAAAGAAPAAGGTTAAMAAAAGGPSAAAGGEGPAAEPPPSSNASKPESAAACRRRCFSRSLSNLLIALPPAA